MQRSPARRVRTEARTATISPRWLRPSCKRDPFVSPIVERVKEGPSCAGSGRQCLTIADVSLRGVVEYPGGLIAVVVSGEHTYFLRENDPLADGVVLHITRDSIVLNERLSDELGAR